jgi:4a-hydroxytetrahydrobiopterin dehydratase
VPRPPRLSPDDVAAALRGLPGWSGGPEGIERTARLPSFRAAVDTLVAIADVAEEMDHHPDLDVRYRELRIAVVTHSAGGVTELDVQLAHRVEELLPRTAS